MTNIIPFIPIKRNVGREIKFRVFDTHCKYFIYFDMSKPMFDDNWNTVQFQCDKVMGDKDEDFSRFILQQYTGLKDRNGVEIYEGDIVEYTFDSFLSSNNKSRKIIKWGENTEEWCSYYGYSLVGSEIEVIGNIYQNPELIK